MARAKSGTCAIAVAVVLVFFATPLGAQRIFAESATNVASAESGSGNTSLAWRIHKWKILLPEWEHSPLLGRGLGTTLTTRATVPGDYYSGKPPHNEYIRYLVETGVVGLAILLFGLGILIRSLLDRGKISLSLREGTVNAATLGLVVVLGCLVNALADNTFINSPTCYAATLIVAAVLSLPKRNHIGRTGPAHVQAHARTSTGAHNGSMSDELVVHHFGPDPASVGGMATVIRVFTEHRVGGDVVDSYPTWRPQSSLGSIRLWMAAARAIRRMPAGDVAHIHLSEKGSFLREGLLVALAHRRGLVTVATIHGASFIPFAEKHPRLVVRCCARTSVICSIRRHSTAFDAAPLKFCRDCAQSCVRRRRLSSGRRDGGAGRVRRRDRLAQGRRRPVSRMAAGGRRRPLPVSDGGPGERLCAPCAERLEVLPPVDSREMEEIMRRARVVALPAREEKCRWS